MASYARLCILSHHISIIIGCVYIDRKAGRLADRRGWPEQQHMAHRRFRAFFSCPFWSRYHRVLWIFKKKEERGCPRRDFWLII